jgi:uncharacterized protein YjbI with pentapeptide repeats
MTSEELSSVLEMHDAYLRGAVGGKRADLTGANLRRANLRWANLRWADLTGAIGIDAAPLVAEGGTTS